MPHKSFRLTLVSSVRASARAHAHVVLLALVLGFSQAAAPASIKQMRMERLLHNVIKLRSAEWESLSARPALAHMAQCARTPYGVSPL